MKKKLLISSLVILGVILAFYALSALTFRFIFPANGYLITTTTDSPSMAPVMKGNTLVFESKNFPFEDLKVGDIIVYRKPRGWDIHISQSSVQTSNYRRKGAPEPTPTPVPTPTPTPLYKDEGIEYKAGYIVHRITEVIDGPGDRALICQGDNNPKADPFPVMKSGYIGKVVWYSNELGPVFHALYRGHIILVPMAVFGILGYMLIRAMMKEE